MRLLSFERLKAVVAIVSAAACFAMSWLGLGDKLSVLAEHVKRVSKRMFGVASPAFFRNGDSPAPREIDTPGHIGYNMAPKEKVGCRNEHTRGRRSR